MGVMSVDIVHSMHARRPAAGVVRARGGAWVLDRGGGGRLCRAPGTDLSKHLVPVPHEPPIIWVHHTAIHLRFHLFRRKTGPAIARNLLDLGIARNLARILVLGS